MQANSAGPLMSLICKSHDKASNRSLSKGRHAVCSVSLIGEVVLAIVLTEFWCFTNTLLPLDLLQEGPILKWNYLQALQVCIIVMYWYYSIIYIPLHILPLHNEDICLEVYLGNKQTKLSYEPILVIDLNNAAEIYRARIDVRVKISRINLGEEGINK